jgi:glucose/mannose transport system permease protein
MIYSFTDFLTNALPFLFLSIDGASEFQIYRRIMLPLLAPVTLSALIILGHMSLKVFDLIIAIAGKQLPLDVPAIYMWQVTFDGLFYGKGAAIGILLLISVAVLIIPYIRYTLRTETQS